MNINIGVTLHEIVKVYSESERERIKTNSKWRGRGEFGPRVRLLEKKII